MPKVVLDTFDGMRPRVDPELLQDSEATYAHNTDLDHGKLDPLEKPDDAPADAEFEVFDEADVMPTPSAPTVAAAAYAFTKTAESLRLRWWGWKGVAGQAGNLPWYYDDGADAAFPGSSLPVNKGCILSSVVYGNAGVEINFNLARQGATVDPENPTKDVTNLYVDWWQPHFDPAQYTLAFDDGRKLRDNGSIQIMPPLGSETNGAGWLPEQFLDTFTEIPLYIESGLDDRGEMTYYKYGKMKITDFVADDFFFLLDTIDEETLEHVYETGVRSHAINIIADLQYENKLIDYCSYVVTYVSTDGAESPPSAPTSPVMRLPGQYVKVTVPTTGMPNPSTDIRRIYRNNPDTGRYQLVKVLLPGDNEDFYDMVPYQKLGYVGSSDTAPQQLESEDGSYGNPPADVFNPEGAGFDGTLLDATKCVYLPGGYWATYVNVDDADLTKGCVIWFSQVGFPYIWPSKYCITLKEGCLGLAVVGSELYILTSGEPYVISANHPKYAYPQKVTVNQRCLSRYTIFTTQNTAGYMGLGGIVVMRGPSADVLTLSHYAIDQWRDMLFAGFNITQSPGEAMRNTEARLVAAVAAAPSKLKVWTKSDKLYVEINKDFTVNFPLVLPTTSTSKKALLLRFDYVDNQLSRHISFDRATTRRLLWRTRHRGYNRPMTFAAARVVCDDYTGTAPVMKMYRNSLLAVEKTLVNDQAFALVDTFPERNWDFQVESESHVDQLAFGTNTRMLREGDG
jgi:hypothetical protein